MTTVEFVAHLDEGREQIELPQALVEAGRLELFDEIPVDVVEPPHHRFDDATGRGVARTVSQTEKVRGERRRVPAQGEEIDRAAAFVALEMDFGRSVGGGFHAPPQGDFGAPQTRREID